MDTEDCGDLIVRTRSALRFAAADPAQRRPRRGHTAQGGTPGLGVPGPSSWRGVAPSWRVVPARRPSLVVRRSPMSEPCPPVEMPEALQQLGRVMSSKGLPRKKRGLLARSAADVPLRIVGAYRDTEVQPSARSACLAGGDPPVLCHAIKRVPLNSRHIGRLADGNSPSGGHTDNAVIERWMREQRGAKPSRPCPASRSSALSSSAAA
jgi:hypothetical protein